MSVDNINTYSNTDYSIVNLQLGDVVKITSKLYLIIYIDNKKIKLLDIDSIEKENEEILILNIDENGRLENPNISQISLISREEYPGYARQNGLLTNTWVNIFFGGDIPFTITGKITNLEEDMIEIKTFPDNDTMYINFEYKGIPEDLPIRSIEIRGVPAEAEAEAEGAVNAESEIADEGVQPSESEMANEGVQPSESEIADEGVQPSESEMANEGVQPSESEMANEGDEEISRKIPNTNYEPPPQINENLRNIILQNDQIVFGNEEFGSVAQYIDVSEKKQRYSIEAQTNDMLDEMLSSIPNANRTDKVLNDIHIIIERFKQLRKDFSLFDANCNLEGIKKRGVNWKPLVNELQEFNTPLYWILPVVKNIKKIYDVILSENEKNKDEDKSIKLLFLKEDLEQINVIIQNYKNNQNNFEESKYDYMMRELKPFFDPKEEIDNESMNDIIYEKIVGKDQTFIVDNNDNLLSFTVCDNDNICSKYSLMERYLKNQKRITTYKNENYITPRNHLYDSETISLKSIITLPEPFMHFSRIQLPGTNIIEKANLNRVFIEFWRIFNKKNIIQNNVISSFENENNQHPTKTLFTGINNHILALFENKNTRNENYKNFLENVIPKTKNIFLQIQKYINGNLSVVDIVKYMEPFLIYSDDLSYFQYKKITQFINYKISQYISNLIERKQLFQQLNKSKSIDNIIKSRIFPILQILHKNNYIEESVLEKYNLKNTGENNITSSQLIKSLYLKDNANLYNISISILNLNLIFPEDLSFILENESNFFEDKQNNVYTDATNPQNTKNPNDFCKKYEISKRYYTLEDLNNDNNNIIYFDKVFDTTNYSTLNDYEKELIKMDSEEFLSFLIKKLKNKMKLSNKDSEYLAKTLIQGNKQVIDGQYAILHTVEENNQLQYFVRDNNIWVLDETIDRNTFINDTNLFCNLQENCIDNNNSPSISNNYGECETLENNVSQLRKNIYQNVLQEFDQKYTLSKDALERKLTTEFNYFLSIFDKLNVIEKSRFLRYNNQQYKIGNIYLKNEDSNQSIIVSPYNKLLDAILSQVDYIKKQNDIILFKNKFTRDNKSGEINAITGIEETPNWYYCIETSAPLLPAFIHTLAYTFINNPSTYESILEKIIQTNGKLSDDGDSWVDKYSGRVIRMIDYDVEEGYEGGFKVKTRDQLEESLGDSLAGKLTTVDKKSETVESKMIRNVVETMSEFMGIKIDNQLEFIKKVVVSLMSTDFMPSENNYKLFVQEMAKKGKSAFPSYKELFNSNILYLTMGAFVIAVQTHIPSIQSKRTFPGCIRSFSGYPFEGNGDDSFIKYVACIAHKIKSNIEPWKALTKKKEDIIYLKIKENIEKHLWLNTEVISKVKDKLQYLSENSEISIPEEYALEKWKQFLPPLIPFKIKNVENITPEFNKDLKIDVLQGRRQQREKLLIIESKIIFFSLSIQEFIRKIIEKKKLLLTNAIKEPFLENSCCNEKYENKEYSAIHYFINENKEIEVYNNHVRKLEDILTDIYNLTRSAYLFCNENSKNVYPVLSSDFTEETIYKAFLFFCKFQSNNDIPAHLLTICNSKPSFSLSMESSIKDIIFKLKEDGKNYTNEDLMILLNLVNRENIININISEKPDSPLENIQKVVQYSTGVLVSETADNPNVNQIDNQNVNTGIIPLELLNLMEKTIETFQESRENLRKNTQDSLEVKKLKNYLAEKNKLKTEKILNFIKNNGNKKRNQDYKKTEDLFMKLFSWEFDENNISDDYTVFNFMKSYIKNISLVFPNIIKNSVSFDMMKTICKHWDLSNIHYKKIDDFIKKYYERLTPFYNKPFLSVVLNNIKQETQYFVELFIETPYFGEIYKNDKKINSIFDKRTCTLLFENYMLSILSKYIDLCDTIKGSKMSSVSETKPESLFDIDIEDEIPSITEGERTSIKTTVSDLIVQYIKIMSDHKKKIDKNYKNIVNRVYRLKEREKYLIRDRLENLSEEERNADTILKINKLGVWNKGLQKGLTKYVKSNYDDERQFIDNLHQVEKNVRDSNNDVNDNNIEQYMDDYLEQMDVDNEIENEANNMEGMDEDYYDGVDPLYLYDEDNDANDYENYD